MLTELPNLALFTIANYLPLVDQFYFFEISKTINQAIGKELGKLYPNTLIHNNQTILMFSGRKIVSQSYFLKKFNFSHYTGSNELAIINLCGACITPKEKLIGHKILSQNEFIEKEIDKLPWYMQYPLLLARSVIIDTTILDLNEKLNGRKITTIREERSISADMVSPFGGF